MKNRKRQPNLFLIKLRKEILGMTQVQFAAMVGVSLPLIKGVETGQLPLADRLARKIRIATGATMLDGKVAKVFCLRPLGGGESTSPLAKEYTKEDFERHRTLFKSNKEAADTALRDVLPFLISLFKKASKSGVAGTNHRLPALTASLWDWMDTARKEFKVNVSWPGPRRTSVLR
jgi:transcriptional regulator with XRE-family HTH domain